MDEVKVGQLTIIASGTCNFISKLLQGGKKWWLLAQLYRDFHRFFVLEVSAMSRFKNIICIDTIITSKRQEKEKRILYKPMKKWEQLQLTFKNSKSEKGQNDY